MILRSKTREGHKMSKDYCFLCVFYLNDDYLLDSTYYILFLEFQPTVSLVPKKLCGVQKLRKPITASQDEGLTTNAYQTQFESVMQIHVVSQPHVKTFTTLTATVFTESTF